MVVEGEDEVEALGVDVELKHVHLDQLQGARGLEAAGLRWPRRLHLGWGVAVGQEDLANGLGIAALPDPAELIVDLAGTEAWVVAPDGEDLLLEALWNLDAMRLRNMSETGEAFGIRA
jgi:hypothetical protein